MRKQAISRHSLAMQWYIDRYDLSIILLFAFLSSFAQLSFTESASSWGIDLGRSKDGGHAFGDYDGDGDLDLLVNTNHNSTDSRLYRNNGNSTYTDVTASLAPYLANNTIERGAVWADFNNDGILDFLRNTSFSGIEVYIQDLLSGIFGDGSGGTTPLIYDSSNISNGVNTEGIGVTDFDGDGDLDIIFDNHNFGVDILRNNYVDHTTRLVVNPPIANLFTHATPGTATILGLDQTATDGDYGSITDLNNDGWVDIFMRKRDKDDLFYNNGGTFSSAGDLAQANNGNKGAVALYDFDNDGDFDAFWTENDLNQIFRNDGGVSWTALGSGGTTGIPTGFTGDRIDEVACGDLDNDGDIDILLVGDHRSYLYINQINDPILGANSGTPMLFVLDMTNTFNNRDGEGTTMVDIDMDGDLDIYMNINNSNNQLWINNLYNSATIESDKDYLFVKVWDDRTAYMQSGAQRKALGATIILEDCNGNVVSGLRELNGGNGHGTQDPFNVHFGLPMGQDYDYKITVKYPNYINAVGDTIRTTISKWIKPSDALVFPITVVFGPGDVDAECPGCKTASLNPHVLYFGRN